MTDATKAFEQLESCLETIRDTDAHTVETLSPGECWWQGDLGVQFLGAERPTLEMAECPTPGQLAPGQTRGSRHMLEAQGVTAYRIDHPLVGYVLHCPQGLSVTHPEHGDVTCKEPGWYAIRYQRAFAEDLRRQQD